MLKIGFAGTSFFSVPFFTSLLENPNFDIRFVMTKNIPESKTSENMFAFLNRNKEKFANLPIYTPHHPSELDPKLFEGLDAMVVVAYGFKIPAELLKVTKWVNVHGSYLPLHRGASPIHYTILNMGRGVGLTAILMNEGIDTGPIISAIGGVDPQNQNDIDFSLDDNYMDLSQKLLAKGPDWFEKVLLDYLSGKIVPQEQDDSQATKAFLIKPKHRVIDWSMPAEEIKAQIQALSPFPCCVIEIGGRNIKAIAATIVDNYEINIVPGTLLNSKYLTIQCGNQKAIRIAKLIPDSGKMMSDEDFLRGFRIEAGILVK